MTIFTPTATYHERVLQDPIPDRQAIHRYWQTKVVQSQANITCKLLSLYLDENTVIAEWEAEFDDLAKGERKADAGNCGSDLRGRADFQPPRILGIRGGRAARAVAMRRQGTRDPQVAPVAGFDLS